MFDVSNTHYHYLFTRFLCEYLTPNLHITISVSYPILIYENTFSLVKKLRDMSNKQINEILLI